MSTNHSGSSLSRRNAPGRAVLSSPLEQRSRSGGIRVSESKTHGIAHADCLWGLPSGKTPPYPVKFLGSYGDGGALFPLGGAQVALKQGGNRGVSSHALAGIGQG